MNVLSNYSYFDGIGVKRIMEEIPLLSPLKRGKRNYRFSWWYNPEIHHRKSIRLKGYDYSKLGAYFITISTHEKQNLFSEIVNGNCELNQLGEIVKSEWLKTSEIRKNIILDEYIIMPDHFHGIIIGNEEGCMQYNPTFDSNLTAKTEFKSPSKTIGSVIRGFKASVTRKIN